MSSAVGVPLPPHDRSVVPWRQSVRGGTVDDRRLSSIEVSIPPDIAQLAPRVPGALAAACDEAVRSVADLDSRQGAHLRPLAAILLRAEGIASSKIEHEEASVEDFARALHGYRANASATSMAAAVGATDGLLSTGELTSSAITTAHARLMADDPGERLRAGRYREEQNWIGGSDHSPRGALYVPPPPALVGPKMDDLVAFVARNDIAVLPQAAIAHAQFESIHPFTDGNGRIGRALAAGVIRRRALARHVVVPIASGLAARRGDYFDALGSYRAGDAEPIIAMFAQSARIAAEESATTAERVAEMPQRWREAAGSPRRGSATAVLIDELAALPVFTTDDLERRLGLATATAYRTVDRLAGAGVLRPLTQRTRNQVWGVADLLEELDDLGIRIAAGMQPQGGSRSAS